MFICINAGKERIGMFSVRKLLVFVGLFLVLGSMGCASLTKSAGEKTAVLRIAAAASLEKVFVQRLLPMYQKENPDVKLEVTYAGSGKLQTQIEQGLVVELFIPAAHKQMDVLQAKGYIASSQPLLKNELVLIVPKDKRNAAIKSFSDFAKAKQPAIGDPKSVPAGQYAKEALLQLKLWDEVAPRLSLGTNVVEVLHWVAEGSADAGLVYATDAASNAKVKVIAAAPKGVLKKPIVYPIGILKKAADNKAAASFVEFLQSERAQKVFAEYGFRRAK